jgi:hypothetical protein
MGVTMSKLRTTLYKLSGPSQRCGGTSVSAKVQTVGRGEAGRDSYGVVAALLIPYFVEGIVGLGDLEDRVGEDTELEPEM